MKIMILASKHNYNKIPKIKKQLIKKGHKLKMPNSYDNPFKEEEIKKLNSQEHIKWKSQMMKKYEKNISLKMLFLY